MKKRGKNFWKEMYSDVWKYLTQSKNFIYASVILFFAFALIGFIFPTPDVLTKQLLEFIKEIVSKTEGLSALGLIRFIFLNNIMSAFFGLFFGIFFGLYPFFSSALNGYVLGFVGNIVASEESIFSLWRLLPHGIFELPAIFISFGLGLKLGVFLFQKDIKKYLRENLINSFKVFIFVVLPLLVIAAIVEGILIFVSR
jgi:stage II sporulation protein M